MLCRRNFIFATASAIFATPAFASDYGLSSGPDLFEAMKTLASVREGRGKGVLNVMFTPWCPATPEIHRETRGLLSEMTINWIPFSGAQPEGRIGTQRILEAGSAEVIPANFIKVGTHPTLDIATPLSDAQDARIGAIEMTVITETGRGLVTPTLTYMRVDERYRYIPGWVNERKLREIAATLG